MKREKSGLFANFVDDLSMGKKISLTKVREILSYCERKVACLEVSGTVEFEFRF